jgi:hypothetical protein
VQVSRRRQQCKERALPKTSSEEKRCNGPRHTHNAYSSRSHQARAPRTQPTVHPPTRPPTHSTHPPLTHSLTHTVPPTRALASQHASMSTDAQPKAGLRAVVEQRRQGLRCDLCTVVERSQIDGVHGGRGRWVRTTFRPSNVPNLNLPYARCPTPPGVFVCLYV